MIQISGQENVLPAFNSVKKDGVVMARQIPFTEYEAALLLDAYLQTVTEGISRRDSVNRCSEDLRRMAVNNGLVIDSTYRNTNGITFQMASMESAYRGKTIVKPATRLFIFRILARKRARIPGEYFTLICAVSCWKIIRLFLIG